MTETANKPKLTEDQLIFVSLIHQHWMKYGSLLTADTAHDLYGMVPKNFSTNMAQENVKTALIERGVELPKLTLDPDDWQSKALTPIQLVMANIMLDLTDTRSNRKKLQDNGIDSKKWAAWLKDPVFREYMETRANSLMREGSYEAQLALMDRASSGDVKAIEFLFELNGTYIRPRAGSGSDFDLRSILVRILEIINDEVEDTDTAMRIADRLKGLGQAHSIATELTEIVMPEIAKPPELNEKLQGVLESGAGHNV